MSMRGRFGKRRNSG
jgi:hypothetical protein